MNTVDKLNDILVDRGLTLAALCQMTGLTRAAFSNAKRRDNQLRIDTIQIVCDALHMPLYEFFMELMTAIFSICGSVVSASMNSIGGDVTTTAALPSEIVSAIEDVGFL